MTVEFELYEALKTIATQRKSIRNYSNRKIPTEYVDKILDIAKTSPYSSGKKNWGIKIVEDPKVLQMATKIIESKTEELRCKVRSDFKDVFLDYARFFRSFDTAPLILVPYFRESPVLSLMIEEEDNDILTWERDNILKSISCVAMLIIIAATSLGLESCYITGALIAEKRLNDLFKIKTGRTIGAIIPIGFKE